MSILFNDKFLRPVLVRYIFTCKVKVEVFRSKNFIVFQNVRKTKANQFTRAVAYLKQIILQNRK